MDNPGGDSAAIPSSFLIDGMVILLALWFRKGYGKYCFLSTRNDERIAAELASEMPNYLSGIPKANRLWIFDGKNPEQSKKSRVANVKRSAKKISKAIRLFFISKKKSIAYGIWRRNIYPPEAIVTKSLKLLIASGETVQRARGEADYLLQKYINDKTIVISSDSDYIFYTNCYAVINPVRR